MQHRTRWLHCLECPQYSIWHTWSTQYRTSDVAENLGRFLVRSSTRQGNDVELIPMVKMKTRNPLEGSFSSEFCVDI